MKRMRRLEALIIVIVALIAMVSGQNFVQAAIIHTSTEAGQWAQSKVGGASSDWDGVYGVQCTDFVMWYAKEFWGVDYAPQGNANAYSWNSMPAGWMRIANTSGFVAMPGDIAVWTYTNTSSAGHVGIVLSADEVGMTIAEQWSSTGSASAQSGTVHSRYFKYNDGVNGFYGVVRPSYSGGSTPSTIAVNEGQYVFSSVNACLTAGEDWNGGNVYAAGINGTAQNWTVARIGSAYRITSQNSPSGRVLNVYTSGTSAAGKNVTLWEVTGNKTQLWLFEQKGDAYRIHPADNLDVALTVLSDNDVRLATNTDAANQLWNMEDIEIKTTPTSEITTPLEEATIIPEDIQEPDTDFTASLPASIQGENNGISLQALMTDVGIKFEWSPSNTPFGYRIYRSTVPGEEGLSISDFPILGNEYMDVNVESDTMYYYTICEVEEEASFDPVTIEVTPEHLGEASDELAVKTQALQDASAMSTEKKSFILMEIGKSIMQVNEDQVEIDPGRGTTPIILNGRTLVPIRAIIETMGGTVGWDSSENKVTLNAYEHDIMMWLNQKDILVDGAMVSTDTAPQSINGRTMLPIRFVADNIGCQITWIGSTRQIVIVYFQNQ